MKKEKPKIEKKNKTEFFAACGAYLTVTVLDLVFTYIATPHLFLEGNPLATEYNFGWGGLITVNVITYILYVLMAYYAFLRYKPPESNETDLKRYLAEINYGDPNKYVPMMWKLPKHWGPQIACLCWSICVIMPFSRLVIVAEWFLMIMNIDAPWFFSIVAFFPMGRIDFFIALIGAWALSGVWIKREYKANLERLEGQRSICAGGKACGTEN